MLLCYIQLSRGERLLEKNGAGFRSELEWNAASTGAWAGKICKAFPLIIAVSWSFRGPQKRREGRKRGRWAFRGTRLGRPAPPANGSTETLAEWRRRSFWSRTAKTAPSWSEKAIQWKVPTFSRPCKCLPSVQFTSYFAFFCPNVYCRLICSLAYCMHQITLPLRRRKLIIIAPMKSGLCCIVLAAVCVCTLACVYVKYYVHRHNTECKWHDHGPMLCS